MSLALCNQKISHDDVIQWNISALLSFSEGGPPVIYFLLENRKMCRANYRAMDSNVQV